MASKLEVADGVAVVTLDNPKMNQLTPDLLNSLFAQLRKAHSNPDVKAVVLAGANGKFCAGFDFTLFGTPAMDQILGSRQHAVAELGALLEGGAKPTVAAIEGACLGGGCELALACNARVAAKGAQLGLPEVRLGVIPGLGGTQRLPRLVGMEQALNLMMSGGTISADDALAIGLVDSVAPDGGEALLEAARRAALDLAAAVAAGTPGARRKALQMTQHMQPAGEVFVAAVRALQAAQDRVLKHMAGQAHYDALLEAVATGLAHGAAAGLQKEGEGFRAACGSRAHALALRLFKLQRGLKHKSGVSGFFTRLSILLLMLYTWLYVRAAYVWTSFMIGYNRARGREPKAPAGVVTGVPAARERRGGGCGSGGGKEQRKRK